MPLDIDMYYQKPLSSVRNQNRVTDNWIMFNVNDYSNLATLNIKQEMKKKIKIKEASTSLDVGQAMRNRNKEKFTTT